MTALVQRLAGSESVAAAARALDLDDAWVVGGAVRDAALRRDVVDVDLAVGAAQAEGEAARRLARAVGGHAFELSAQFATWRVVAPAGRFAVDVGRLRGGSIEADLAARDFTINAMAIPLAAAAGDRSAAGDRAERHVVDPHGGLRDLEAGVLRAVSDTAFADDPLRILRAARFTAALELELAPSTVELGRAEAARAAEPAGERQFAELRRIVAGPDPLRGLAVIDELRAMPAVLPELHALRGVEQNPYHHLDVHGHTTEVLRQLVEIERRLPDYAGEHSPAVAAVLDEPLADELTRAGALRLGALFHDLGKPETRRVDSDGRVLFVGHDRAGARLAGRICARLRTSRRLRAYLEGICLNHLRLGFLVHERPVSRRAVYEYLDATEPDAIDVTLLTVADRLATRGERTRQEAIDAHLELAAQIIGEAIAWRDRGRPRAPIRGDELAAALGIDRGPELGRLLRELEAAAFAGEISQPDEAVEMARRLLAT